MRNSIGEKRKAAGRQVKRYPTFKDALNRKQDTVHQLWGNISCPTQLHYGADSWASNPEKDGRMQYFGDNVSVKEFADAGHWLHHDQFELFVETLRDFL
ncbi:alpha/beta hydrolase [Sphingorhabdus sp. SMR4y]|nr:alpha/beta hydrolase [Sphingorhabdus sp. SMR4y]